MDVAQQELVNWLKSMGADLVGFAPVERFAGAPSYMHPAAHLPSARTVIVIGVHHPDAAIEFEGEPTPHHMGPGAIQGAMNTKLEHIAFWLARRLEAGGSRTVTVPATNVWRFRPFTEDGNVFTPDLSNIHAAAAAGLGEIGLSGLFLSPQFGPRQRLQCTITEAEFEPTPMYQGEPLCDVCQECVVNCPMDAFRQETDGMSVVEIDGSTFEYVKKNKWRCAWMECFGFNVESDRPDAMNEEAVLEAMAEHGRYSGYGGHCLRFCMTPDLRIRDPGYSRAPRRRKIAPTQVPFKELWREVQTKGGNALAVLPESSFGTLPDDPRGYLPGCRSILLVGAPRQSAPRDQAYVDAVLAESLRHLTLDLDRVLERHGHEAMPLPHRLGKPYPARPLVGIASTVVGVPLDEGWHWEPVLTTAALPGTAQTLTEAATNSVSTGSVRARALEAGADLVGVASAAQIESMLPAIRKVLAEADYEWDVVDAAHEHATTPHPQVRLDSGFRFLGPTDYVSGARSVVVLGLALHDVVLQRAGEPPAMAVGPYSYQQFQTSRELVLLASRVAQTLRDVGHRACVSMDLCRTASRVMNPRGRQLDAWANRFAAAAAGLATIGRHGAPITPEYGVHQRFVAVVTDAPLEPTAVEVLGSPCGDCNACVAACPVGAIQEVSGGTDPLGWLQVDKVRCDWAKKYGLEPEEGPVYCGSRNKASAPASRIRPDDVFAAVKTTDPLQKNLTCIFEGCLKACPGFPNGSTK